MLTPRYLLKITEAMEAASSEYQSDVISRIVERIVARMERGEEFSLSSADLWNVAVLQDSGMLAEEISKRIAQFIKVSERLIYEAVMDAANRTWQYDSAIYRAAGIAEDQLRRSPYYNRLLERSYEKLLQETRNLTGTTADIAQRVFIEATNKAYFSAAAGAEPWTSATRRAIDEAIKSGLDITYPTGHRDTVETATARAVRTSISQTAAEITDRRMQEMDWDVVDVSAHMGARPEHAVWQGKQYSRFGRTPELPRLDDATGYGSVTGLCGANCRHSYGPGVLGITHDWGIDKQRSAELYDQEQQQRAMERAIRKSKGELQEYQAAIDAAKKSGDEELAATLQAKYDRKAETLHRRNERYNEYCAETGLKKQQDRLYVGGWTRSDASKASAAAKRYETAKNSELRNAKNNDIIDTSRNAEILRSKINDGSITTVLNYEKQSPHMYETRETGKSYFKEGITEDDLQKIINECSGTGIIYVYGNGQIKEVIDYDSDIAVNVLPKSLHESDTNRFTIHYSKKRTHAVPAQKKEN